MRRMPVTIGIVVAELAVGALVGAPPAAADDAPDEAASVDIDAPIPEPAAPTVSVRTGRAGQLAELPAELPELPLADGTGDAPTPTDPPAAPSSPPPAPAASPSPASVPVPTGAPSPSSTPPAAAPPSHVVATGDSLWEIAAVHLAQSTGRDRATLGAADIVGYWVRVCETNRSRLRSGDLDLIFPGEVVDLPPV